MVHRLYADENFPLQVVVALRRLGHDVLTVQDSGHAGRAVSDLAILTFATAQQRTVLTLNRRDFIRLHEQYTQHAGIIACTFDWTSSGRLTVFILRLLPVIRLPVNSFVLTDLLER